MNQHPYFFHQKIQVWMNGIKQNVISVYEKIESSSSRSKEIIRGKRSKKVGKLNGKMKGSMNFIHSIQEINRPLSSMILLIFLYLLQGVPLGLVMGSLPYLLQPSLSFTSLGFFSLASYPYSLKLFWSPIVDTVYYRKWGRRKSWIIPIQSSIGICLLWISYNIQEWMEKATESLKQMTIVFFILVFLCATQDIAVDGWALTLLSEENLVYASTAQSIGLNTGYFLSFTVFLAFNSSEFTNKYFRSIKKDFGLISLSGYIRFWGWVFIVSTMMIMFFQNEKKKKSSSVGIRNVYLIICNIIKLPRNYVALL